MDTLLYAPAMQRGGRSTNTMSSDGWLPVNRGTVPKDSYHITREMFQVYKDIHKPFCQVSSKAFVHLYRFRAKPFRVCRSMINWREVFYYSLPVRPVPYNHIRYLRHRYRLLLLLWHS